MYNVAVIGATGTVGAEVLKVLSERDFPVKHMYALASDNSLGREVSFGEQDVRVEALEAFDFSHIDLVFFCAGSKVAIKYIPKILNASKAYIIDKSSHYRMDPDVPLVVPEVNAQTLGLAKKRRLIANPNCVVIPLAAVLKPLSDVAALKRIVISTYQSVSGAGKMGMDELFNHTRAVYVNDPMTPEVFPKTIAFNVIPQIGSFEQDGATGEEAKVMLEMKKILTPSLKISATCVRVPVFIGHCISVNAEFSSEISVQEAREAIAKAEGVMLIDRPEEDVYATPIDIAGEDMVCVSRLRKDTSVPNGLSLWIACDNLRKGAALNAVQIAMALHDEDMLGVR